mgnify:CR=1 FL=1|tara:strand:+ start:66984 stop:69521 length:2538 start_codon:yes stop_codon:yes gene_type:complete
MFSIKAKSNYILDFMNIEKTIKKINEIVWDKPLIIHTDIGNILKTYPSLLNKNRTSVFENFTRLLKEELHSNFVFIPTFNYKYCKSQSYDIYNSPAELGAYSEYARKNFADFRTLVPVFNHVDIKGKHIVEKKDYLIDLAFGKHSFYDWFTDLNGYILFWGCDPNKTNTYLHHIEKISGVNYRYEKIFPGFLTKNLLNKKIKFSYFVRNNSIDIEYIDQGIGFLTKNSSLFIENQSQVAIYNTKSALKLITAKINADPYFLLNIKTRNEIANLIHNEDNLASLNQEKHKVKIISDINLDLLIRSWGTKKLQFSNIYSNDIILGLDDYSNKLNNDDILVLLLSFNTLKVDLWNNSFIESNKLKESFFNQSQLLIDKLRFIQNIFKDLKILIFSPLPTAKLSNLTTSSFEEILLRKELVNFDEMMFLSTLELGINYFPSSNDYHGDSSFLSEINYLRYRYPFNLKTNFILKERITNKILTFLSQTNTIKAISTDFDDTIWHGIAGDGEATINNDYPYNVHLYLQLALKKLKETGCLLIATTKNELSTIKEVFSELKDNMYLNLDDFSSIQANWQPKSNSIRKAAEELNISTDSILHIDDSIFEINEIRSSLPGTEVIRFTPENIDSIISKIMNHPRINKNKITITELNRNNQIKSLSLLKKHSKMNVISKNYLKSLLINISLINGEIKNADKNRFHQLFNKTNQFNLAQRRFTKSEIEEFNKKNCIFGIYYSDKFSSQEIPSAIRVDFDKKENLVIKDFVLSCRFFSRGIEYYFLNCIIKLFKGDKLYMNLIKSKNNKPCFTFLKEIADEKVPKFDEIAVGTEFNILLNKKRISSISNSYKDVYKNG